MNANEIAGERIHILMRRERRTQVALATVLGMKQSGVSKKLRGERPWDLDELLAVASWLDVPITDLLPGPEYTARPKGLEPLTFWFGADLDAEYEALCAGLLLTESQEQES